ncbi:tight junction protein ZO-1 isoform X6 [Cryptotermes secundus]|uniref:tight junction protein ZO-1 isoform X6 n=1 Tax=Cryptotermes secundus TaxID=105785 RepID=UPI000CD7B729|nr:tight junction protein ZO-1 isoform X6 [Cryptotermes secundus]
MDCNSLSGSNSNINAQVWPQVGYFVPLHVCQGLYCFSPDKEPGFGGNAAGTLTPSSRRSSLVSGQLMYYPTNSAVLEEPVEEKGGERIVWEYHHVTLTRVPGYGFGIAVSGGRDNPHFTSGDPAIAISDVLKAGPAEGKLQVNDRIISANGVSLENVEYATAVQVLRDSGNTVLLVVRRRVVLPACPEPQTLKLSLTKSKKKDDFGLVLGCKIYVREVATNRATLDGVGGKDSGGTLQEGDILLKINNHTTEGLSLKEARKLIEASKEKLNLVIRREHKPGNNVESTALPKDSHGNYLDGLSGPNYSSQNLYVQPPTRSGHPTHQHNLVEDKSNLVPRGRSRGPLLEVSLSQLDRPATPVGLPHHHAHSHSHSRSRSGLDDAAPSLGPPDPLGSPPRPPPPRPEDYYSSSGSRRQLYEEDPLLQRSKQPMPDPRFITFQKEGSVGIRLTGGNEVGIFVTAVQPGSPASLQGLQPGDKILKVNDMDMKGVTREEAVLFLLSLQDQIDLIVQYRKDEYEQIVASQRGDSFHIKAHFNYDQPNKGEMSFRKGDVFHVVDTLHNGVVGSWQVFRIGRNNHEVQKGIIPNKSRAEELATAQFNATKKELTASESRGSFFRRRRGSHRRSKSLSRDHWDDVVFADSISKFPAYERVVLRHPGFVRPVVLFGPVSDIAREKMLKDFPDKFTSPQLDNNLEDVPKSQKSSGIIRLSAIRDIMDRGKHALLDITPNAVDRLNYAQFYPIVIFLRAESKHVIKELRAGLSNSFVDVFGWAAHKSSKKLFEQCQKLEKVWGHTFSCSITLTSPESWYRKVRELIDKQQSAPVWMSENKNYESHNGSAGGLGPSDHLSHHHHHGGHSHNLPLSLSNKRRSQGGDSKYGFSPPPHHGESPVTSSTIHLNYPPPHSHQHQGLGPPVTRSPPGQSPPELPPRIDRSNKPSRGGSGTLSRSAAERLFGKGDGGSGDAGDSSLDPPNYINATPHHRPTGQTNSSLERHNMKTSSYDSVSSYDSYNNRLGPNAHDDLKCGTSNGTGVSPRNHDPYRFTRSTAQPISNKNEKPSKPPDYNKHRPGDYKPMPPPKTGAPYKPVPPPKPKNYRPPLASEGGGGGGGSWGFGVGPPTQPCGDADSTVAAMLKQQTTGLPTYQHAKSYSVAGGLDAAGYMPQHNGGEDTSGGFDSGHGSSLDRSYNPGAALHRGQYYYNIPAPNRSGDYHRGSGSGSSHHHNREPSGLLDLANREQRGSAFELYKKPSNALHHYLENNLRGGGEVGEGGDCEEVVATARGVFTHEGGTLSSPDTGVAIIIPPGALPIGSQQEIYFKVCRDTSMLPPLDQEKGETLLSPLVLCGPHGLKFRCPVELQLPHWATCEPPDQTSDSNHRPRSFALKSGETTDGQLGRPSSWQSVAIDSGGPATSIGSNSVSVLVDHF